MPTHLVCLPQYAYSNVQFHACAVYIKHTTHFTAVTGRRRDCVLVVCLVPRMPHKLSKSRGSRVRSRPYPVCSVGSRSSSRLGGTISPSPRSSSPPQPVSSTNEQFL